MSQKVGYTVRGQGEVRVPQLHEIRRALESAGHRTDLLGTDESQSELASKLTEYFSFRARVLNTGVRDNLMDADSARDLFEAQVRRLAWQGSIPMNKQRGDKRTPAYLTAIVNMMVEEYRGQVPVDCDPHELVTVSRGGFPVRTLARRMDGAFPSSCDPVAVWEVKEYYYTTTFGSRVADGVYETMLDGMELEELREHEGIDIKHYLMIDGRYTWWDCGRSYLCRLVDMLHMGLVDEVLVGRECAERLPGLVAEWVRTVEGRSAGVSA